MEKSLSTANLSAMTTTLPYPVPYEDLYIYYLKGRIGDDPVAEEENFIGNWEEEEDSFLFFKSPAEMAVAGLLERKPRLVLQDSYQMPYAQWQGQAAAPFSVGSLRVVPPWHDEAAKAGEDAILLDPGVVFGTGTHPTTRDCLEAVQQAFAAASPWRVLDLGTGTGLLALAAVRLGARQVLAVDLNRLAAATAGRNAVLNRMSGRMLAVQGNAINFIDVDSDLMLSNIHYEVMRQLITAPGFLRHRQFILSGLLRSQAGEIELLLQKKPVEIVRTWERDGIWHTYYGRRSESFPGG